MQTADKRFSPVLRTSGAACVSETSCRISTGRSSSTSRNTCELLKGIKMKWRDNNWKLLLRFSVSQRPMLLMGPGTVTGFSD